MSSRFSVTKKLIVFVFFILLLELLWYNILYSDFKASITPGYEILFSVLVKIWSAGVEVLQVTLVGQVIN